MDVRGKMMALPLTITEIMRHAERHHGEAEVVSVTADQGVRRCCYSQVFMRANQLAGALAQFGLKAGDRVGTLAWNDHRHLELYYGASCAGYVLHTVNPRLFAEHLVYIINHAEDRALFFDAAFLPLVTTLVPKLPTVEHYVVLGACAEPPLGEIASLHSYEELISEQSTSFAWPDLDESSACVLCYTSGTTGKPKGVLYSHRSTVLHAYASVMPDAMGLSGRDVVLPVVPMFHVNAWGMPYSCPITGAKLVLPGPKMADGQTRRSRSRSGFRPCGSGC
jgi:fatty-acyl-CoA synthase